MEQDRFRGQALAAFDAFVPGTAAFQGVYSQSRYR